MNLRYLHAMSIQAYILIQTDVGKASSVAQAISAIAGVTIAEGVTGPYDVIMRAEAPSMEEFGRVILSKVQAVPGITRTLTCPVTSM
jgi:DNA-binding Lrp family transcriptional regulator